GSSSNGKINKPILGTDLQIRDVANNPGKRKVVVRSKDTNLIIGPAGTQDDPVVAGAVLMVVNPTTNEFDTYQLPPANWVRLGTKGYKYSDSALVNGPCKTVTVKKGGFKASCTGDGIAYSLDEHVQQNVGLRLVTGNLVNCMLFG